MANDVKVRDEDKVPAYLQGYTGPSKNSNMESDDLIIPRIKLLQAISPEVTAFDDAKAGIYWHNVLNQSMGNNFQFIVVSAKKHYILFAPRGDARTVLARAPDGKHWDLPNESFEVKLKGVAKPVVWQTKGSVAESRLAEFGTMIPGDPQSPPAATLIYEYLVYLPEHPDLSPAIMSLSRSSIKRGKDLNSKLELRSTQYPQFAQLYRAVVTEEKGDEGPYSNWSFKSDGVADENSFNTAVALAKRFEASSYRAADEDMRDEVSPNAGAAVPF